jgi:preprotein translocase subunit SecE
MDCETDMDSVQIMAAEINGVVVGLWLGLLAVLVFVVVRYRKELLGFGQKARAFLQEVYVELRKSTWPTWIELRDSTVVVIIAVIVLAAFVGVADLFFSWVVEFLTKRG